MKNRYISGIPETREIPSCFENSRPKFGMANTSGKPKLYLCVNKQTTKNNKSYLCSGQ